MSQPEVRSWSPKAIAGVAGGALILAASGLCTASVSIPAFAGIIRSTDVEDGLILLIGALIVGTPFIGAGLFVILGAWPSKNAGGKLARRYDDPA
jgi:hypothetical protein